MNCIKNYSIVVFGFLLFFSGKAEEPISFNTVKEKVDEVVTEYMVHTEFLLSRNSSLIDKGEEFFALKPSLEIDVSNDLHEFGFGLSSSRKTTLNTYSRFLGNDYRGQLSGEFLEESIVIDMECPIYNNGIPTYLVKTTKIMSKGSVTHEFDYLIGITPSKAYALDFAFIVEDRVINGVPNNECQATNEKEEIEAMRRKAFKMYYDEGIAYMTEGNIDYFKAKEAFRNAQKLDDTNEDVKFYLLDIDAFIKEDINNQKLVIQGIIDQGNFLYAKEELERFKEFPETDDEWIANQIQYCNSQIRKERDINAFYRAENLVKGYQGKKALEILQTLTGSPHLDQAIVAAIIKEAREQDPQYIQKQLDAAYRAAVKNKKNFLATFRTYSKFEASGLLNGDQYYFMCLMMLNKHSVIAKPMGYTRSQASLLSRVYFYKAKDKGQDVSFVESQIFTRSIERRN